MILIKENSRGPLSPFLIILYYNSCELESESESELFDDSLVSVVSDESDESYVCSVVAADCRLPI